MMENKQRLVYIVIIGVLLVSNVFLAFNYFYIYRQSQAISSTQNKSSLNEKVVNFASMFIQKVLQADKEVDFETRLSLENAVRDLKDEEIMAEWQTFTASKTETDAQNSVKRLLGILIAKIQK